MAEIVYIMCAVLSIACAVMLQRGYHHNRSHLLLWGSFCFVGLALNNVILVVDLVLLPQIEFNGSFWRSLVSALSGALLLFGLIWELT